MYVFLNNISSERIQKKRALPCFNAAGWNRSIRVANAMASQKKTVLVSSGCVARIGFSFRLFHRGAVERHGHVIVAYGWCIAVPYLCALFEPVAMLQVMRRLNRRKKIEGLLVYNYHPVKLAACLICRLWYKVPLVLELEDISQVFLPRRRRAQRQHVRWFHQAVTAMCLKVMTRIVGGYIVPTRRFLLSVPKRPHLVVSGCMPVLRMPPCGGRAMGEQITLLFSGQFAKEHGLDLFLEALAALDQVEGSERFAVAFCGGAEQQASKVREHLQSLQRVTVDVHGFLPHAGFRQVFAKADVCLALQDPCGYAAMSQVPSKLYEAMASGKAVICSDVGDFAELPPDTVYLLKDYRVEALTDLLLNLSSAKIRQTQQAAYQYASRHWDDVEVGRNIDAFFERLRQKADQGCP